MNRLQLFKKLLPGLLPLLIFIAADEIWGTSVGLIVAVAVGNIQLVVIYFRERRLDRFVLFDTLLIVALGMVSIALDNDVFFKLKPALIGLIICIFLGISSFSRKNLLLLMSQRYMGGVELQPEHQNKLKRSIQLLFFIFLAHTILVLYSAFYMSKEAWAFISGGLFYILFGAYFIYEVVSNKIGNNKSRNSEEWFPLVDEEGKVIGKATRKQCHSNNKLLHPVVHLQVVNNRKQLFLQKRPMFKDIQPGKWDTAVGGHVALNETIEKALAREAEEEINLKDFDPRFMAKYVWKSDKETELVFSFVAVHNNQIEINTEELADGRFWDWKEIENGIGKELFTPNFEHEFSMLKKYLRFS